MKRPPAAYLEFFAASETVAAQFATMRASIAEAVEAGGMTKRQGDAAMTVIDSAMDLIIVIRDQLWADPPPEAEPEAAPAGPDAPAPVTDDAAV